MDNDLILEVIAARKHYPVTKGFISKKNIGTVKAVDNVSFKLYRGETLGVIGESGCGKSTLAKLIMGLAELSGGEIRLNGKPVRSNMPLSMRRNIQMIFQDPYSSLDPRMNVRRIVEEPLRIHERLSKEEKNKIVLPIMEQVGLSADALRRFPHEFSGGQRQRIGIARALMLNPELIVCDEPVSALDVSIQAQVLNLFASLKKMRGLTYVFISHDMSVIKHVSDRIMVMYLGQVMEIASKRDLFGNARHPYTQALMSAIPKPNPAVAKDRIILEGDLPSPIHAPAGCPFRSRCPQAMDKCHIKPEFKQVSEDHYAACHLVNDEVGAS
ncbi:ABC transporter ATP-binding protein [Cohnella cellulosilytica]|uniref:ABC transporter ATP-binding protein n=1 Tax=Cohnella cellulosilytica TaxID=986710 RepID=A0ABW2FGR6_9BACL